jgi:hypothetical protein
MRFYPHGSGSIPGIAVSASSARYALTGSFATTVLSASFALKGGRGPAGPAGNCIYMSGSTGPQGPAGSQGPSGTVDGPFTSY